MESDLFLKDQSKKSADERQERTKHILLRHSGKVSSNKLSCIKINN